MIIAVPIIGGFHLVTALLAVTAGDLTDELAARALVLADFHEIFVTVHEC